MHFALTAKHALVCFCEKIVFVKYDSLENCTSLAEHWGFIVLQKSTVHQGEQTRQSTPCITRMQGCMAPDCASVAEPASARHVVKCPARRVCTLRLTLKPSFLPDVLQS